MTLVALPCAAQPSLEPPAAETPPSEAPPSEAPPAAVAPAAEAPAAVAPPAPAPLPAGSLWKDEWPQFSLGEGLLTLTAGVGAGVLAFLPAAKDARWEGPILFDRPVRRALRADDESTRKSVRSFGDKVYFAAPVIPLLVDSLVVSLIVRRDTKAAANLAAISAEAFAYTGLLTFSALRGAARQRPDSSECRRTAVDPDSCGDDDTESFYSGHTAVSATSAGLVCATHTRMPLWGHPVADAAACGLAVAGALATGTSRMIADRHYPTDVLLGLGVGFGIGYAVPVLLHFERRNKTQLSLSADPHCSGPCVALRGTF